MNNRILRQRVYELRPALPRVMGALAETSEACVGVELANLIKIRCSQINGCAFCLHMHSAEARKQGERQHRLDTLSAWRDTAWFDERERAALEFAEAVTDLAHKDVSDSIFTTLQAHFSEQEIVDLAVVAMVINSWNRLVATMKFIPEEL